MIKMICVVLSLTIVVGISSPGYAKGSKPKKESVPVQKNEETHPGYTGTFADPYGDKYQKDGTATPSAKSSSSTWKIDGFILSEANHKALIAKDDTVYIEFRPGTTIAPGMKCAVYRKRGKIKSFETRKGHKVKVVQQIGNLLITSVTDNIATATVMSVTEPLTKGDAVLTE